MQGVATRNLRPAFLAAVLAAGLAGCQATGEQKPQVQASLPKPGMDSDIRNILTQGGLNADAPGKLQTRNMPPDVQQAVAALQGTPAAAGAQASSAVAASPAPPAGQQTTLAMTGAPATAGNALAFAGQPAAEPPSAAGSTGLLPPLPPMAAGIGAPAHRGRGGGQSRMASAEPAAPSSTASLLPSPMPHMRTVLITGPGAASQSRQSRERATAQERPSRVAAAPPAPVARPAPPVAAVEPEAPKVRRF